MDDVHGMHQVDASHDCMIQPIGCVALATAEDTVHGLFGNFNLNGDDVRTLTCFTDHTMLRRVGRPTLPSY